MIPIVIGIEAGSIGIRISERLMDQKRADSIGEFRSAPLKGGKTESIGIGTGTSISPLGSGLLHPPLTRGARSPGGIPRSESDSSRDGLRPEADRLGMAGGGRW